MANNSIPRETVPENIQKKQPKDYDSISTTLLGRLAVDIRFQKHGLGKLLLIDALKRSYKISRKIGSLAVVVDPLDKGSTTFYLKYGFIRLPDSGKMFLPMHTVARLFE